MLAVPHVLAESAAVLEVGWRTVIACWRNTHWHRGRRWCLGISVCPLLAHATAAVAGQATVPWHCWPPSFSGATMALAAGWGTVADCWRNDKSAAGWTVVLAHWSNNKFLAGRVMVLARWPNNKPAAGRTMVIACWRDDVHGQHGGWRWRLGPFFGCFDGGNGGDTMVYWYHHWPPLL